MNATPRGWQPLVLGYDMAMLWFACAWAGCELITCLAAVPLRAAASAMVEAAAAGKS